MDRFGLPLGCILMGLSLAATVVAMTLRGGTAVWAGLGAAALLGYAGVMAVHQFDRAAPPVR